MRFEQEIRSRSDPGRRLRGHDAIRWRLAFAAAVPRHTTKIEESSGEYLARNNITQLAISETQKYGHVAYFWNGNRSRNGRGVISQRASSRAKN
jgi:bisphosphoglycerate-independent phosphoglycerate mutase (AlkP superfamily)